MNSVGEPVLKQGPLRKKGTRMYQWSSRHFLLCGPVLRYKLKPEDSELRGEFHLTAGCIVTDIEEDSGGLQGRRLYSFWIVWPQDRNLKGQGEADKGYESAEEADFEGLSKKDLKTIVANEARAHRETKERVEEQLQLHESHDRKVNVGLKVAAAVAGGVVIGASTAGVGLIPYMVVVGTALAAGAAGAVGSAAWNGSQPRPQDSRVILGAETREDAKEWKQLIEQQVSLLERRKRAPLPSGVNPFIVVALLEMNGLAKGWRKVRTVEGVRILERASPCSGTKCRRAQVTVRNTPVDTFLTLMEIPVPFPPGRTDIECDLKVLKIIDDHADVIRLAVNKKCSSGVFGANRDGFSIEVILHRFWKYDDDGVYLITYTSTGQTQFSAIGVDVPKTSSQLELNMIMTVSPRKDHKDFDDDLPEALVTCTCQMSESGWSRLQLESFMDCVLMQIIDLRHYFQTAAYVRYKAGQELECKFTHSSVYSSERIVARLRKNDASRTPVFERKDATTPPLSKESSIASVRSKLSRTFSGEIEEPKHNSDPTESPKSPAPKPNSSLSLFRRNRTSDPKTTKASETKSNMHIDVTRDDNGMRFKEDQTKLKQFATKVKGKIAALEYGI